MLGRDGEAPPRLGRGASDEAERSDGGDAGEHESRAEPTGPLAGDGVALGTARV